MTQEQKSSIERMHAEGFTYAQVAEKMNCSLSTIKMYFHRQQHGKKPLLRCEHCRQPMTPGSTRKKRFCSSRCRCKWHQSHLQFSPNAEKYTRTCQSCGRTYLSIKQSNFCSRPCFADSLRKVIVSHE